MCVLNNNVWIRVSREKGAGAESAKHSTMASRFNIYSQLVISASRIADITNCE